jgi:hypothetical protein
VSVSIPPTTVDPEEAKVKVKSDEAMVGTRLIEEAVVVPYDAVIGQPDVHGTRSENLSVMPHETLTKRDVVEGKDSLKLVASTRTTAPHAAIDVDARVTE